MTDNLLQPDEGEPQIDPNKKYFEELVGEGKKFASAEDLAKGKFYADQTVEIMKKRLDEQRADYLKLREESMAQANLKELTDQLKQQLASSENNQNANEVKDKPTIDPKEIESLVSNKILEHETSKKASDNFNIVANKLKEEFGNNYASILKQRSTDLGLTDEDVNSLARKSPTAFFRTLGLDKQEQVESFQSPPRSNQRNDNFSPSGAKKRTWAYYQELKKANPMLYSDKKITAQMAKDAVELGETFRDGDYFVRGLHDQ